jgi:hypothetical protein
MPEEQLCLRKSPMNAACLQVPHLHMRPSRADLHAARVQQGRGVLPSGPEGSHGAEGGTGTPASTPDGSLCPTPAETCSSRGIGGGEMCAASLQPHRCGVCECVCVCVCVSAPHPMGACLAWVWGVCECECVRGRRSILKSCSPVWHGCGVCASASA